MTADGPSYPVELNPYPKRRGSAAKTSRESLAHVRRVHTRGDGSFDGEDELDNDRNESLPSPTTAPEQPQEMWNSPRINVFRVFATFWSFVVMGLNDATYGVCGFHLD